MLVDRPSEPRLIVREVASVAVVMRRVCEGSAAFTEHGVARRGGRPLVFAEHVRFDDPEIVPLELSVPDSRPSLMMPLASVLVGDRAVSRLLASLPEVRVIQASSVHLFGQCDLESGAGAAAIESGTPGSFDRFFFDESRLRAQLTAEYFEILVPDYYRNLLYEDAEWRRAIVDRPDLGPATLVAQPDVIEKHPVHRQCGCLVVRMDFWSELKRFVDQRFVVQEVQW